jgi:hypothetical protein
MGVDRASTYKKALATFDRADTEVRRLVDAMTRGAGQGAAVIADWERIVPEVNGKTFGCAAWLQSFPRVNITGLPHADELIAALGTWHTAKMIVTNSWLQLAPSDRARVLPFQRRGGPSAAVREFDGP